VPWQRPLLLVDVDGVLSLFGFDAAAPPPGRPALIDGLPHWLSFEAARALRRAAPAFDVAWCTGWEERAEEHLPHLLDLPRGWPHVPLGRGTRPGVSLAGHWKLDAIDAFAGRDRPVAWVDDAHDDACMRWVATRPGPSLLLTTDPAVGFKTSDADTLISWAARLPLTPPPSG
jgi:hypothetical protein